MFRLKPPQKSLTGSQFFLTSETQRYITIAAWLGIRRLMDLSAKAEAIFNRLLTNSVSN